MKKTTKDTASPSLGKRITKDKRVRRLLADIKKTYQSALLLLKRHWPLCAFVGLAALWFILLLVIYDSVSVPEGFPAQEQLANPYVGNTPDISDAVNGWFVLPLVVAAVFVFLSLIAAVYRRMRRPIVWLQIIVVVGFLISTLASYYYGNMESAMSRVIYTGWAVEAPKAADAVVSRLQCSDVVRMVSGNGYAAKEFYDLKNDGWHLAATYQSESGLLDTDAACDTYFSIRSDHTSDKIILQQFTYNSEHQAVPYFNEKSQQHENGIFVKD